MRIFDFFFSAPARFTNNSFEPYSARPGRISASACAFLPGSRFIIRSSPAHRRRLDLKHAHRSPRCDDLARFGSFSVLHRIISLARWGQTFLSVRLLVVCQAQQDRRECLSCFLDVSSASDIVVNPRCPADPF